jgi:NAD+ synthase (glutamine-hydrolysing)
MLRIGITQFRPSKGDYAENLRRLGASMQQAGKLAQPPQLLIAPEAATSGYFLEEGVREMAVTAGTLARDLAEQHKACGAPPLDVAIGFYELFQREIYNSCLYVSLGGKTPQVRHVHRKVFLPTYGVFDEKRFVRHGDGIQAFDTDFGRVAILICEDAWHSMAGTIAALDGAQLIIVPSASPGRGTATTEDGAKLPASAVRWERVVRGVAEEHGVFVAVAQLVGFEGGKGFPGGSTLVGPGGQILLRGPLFEESLLVGDVDFDLVTRARQDAPLLADLKLAVPGLAKDLVKRETRSVKRNTVRFDAAVNGTRPSTAPGSRLPAHGSPLHVIGPALDAGDPLALDCDLVRRWLVSFLKDEVVRARGFAKGIVGISGGVDSALTAFLAVEALGKENVIGVMMPHKTSSPQSIADAKKVIATLGIQGVTVDISAAVDGYLAQVGDDDPHRKGNVMARQRMIALFDLSQKYKALPLGTSNKSERLLGYFTWHGDDAPPVNPLGDLFKTQVWALARHVGVPEDIVSKPATADLIKGQTDEGDLGITYPKADRILYYLLRGFRADEIVAHGFTRQEVELVRGRLSGTHWKRKLPTVAMVSQTAIGEYYLRPVDY